jgi:hypothetical protein
LHQGEAMPHPMPLGNSPSQTASSLPSGVASQPPNSQMGKGLTPQAPDVTAEMMAGPQAMQQLEEAQSQNTPKPGGKLPGNVAQNPSPSATSGQPGESQVTSQSPQEHRDVPSQKTDSGFATVKDGTLKTADFNGSAKAAATEPPWMAKLPPELRNAIRAEAQRPAPKGYEERLRNYFKNIE